MNKELIFKIIAVKKYNKYESILDILAIFDNIINKYSRKLNGEDTKQDLYVFLIKLIKNIDELSIVNYEEIVWGYDFIESNIEVLDSINNLNNYEKNIMYFILNLCAKFSLKSQPSIYGKYGKWIL